MRPPLAYIDPQSGSYIFQVVVGALLGAGVAIKVFWRRIVNFVTRKNSPSKVEQEAETKE